MSTQTEHLGLHQWEPEDSFLRSDFNEDHGKLDAAVGALQQWASTACTVGSYVSPRSKPVTLELGFRPKVVLFMAWAQAAMLVTVTEEGGAGFYYRYSSGSSASSCQICNVQFTDTGLVIPSGTAGINNYADWKIYYIAFR